MSASVPGRTSPLRWSALSLLAANLVPLWGVTVGGWDPAMVLLLFWLENGVIGAATVVRIIGAAGRDPRLPLGGSAGQAIQKLLLVPFFCFHYGIFWVAHGAFVVGLWVFTGGGASLERPTDILSEANADGFWVGLAALAGSHAVSLAVNYFGNGEYRYTHPMHEMRAVYGRVVLLHLVLIGGFFLYGMVFANGGDAAWIMVVGLVLGKIVLDLVMHVRSHRRRAERATATS